MQPCFEITHQTMEDAGMHDGEKHQYIQNHVGEFLKTKLGLLNGPDHRVECGEHGMEEYDTGDACSIGSCGSCPGDKFADWEATFTATMDAKFRCGGEFQIGYNLHCRYGDIGSVLERLRGVPDAKFVQGMEFDERSRLVVITGMTKNNFSFLPSLHSAFWHS